MKQERNSLNQKKIRSCSVEILALLTIDFVFQIQEEALDVSQTQRDANVSQAQRLYLKLCGATTLYLSILLASV